MKKELITQADVDGYLNDVARRMIDEATSVSGANILSATGFARENISIIHQQLRTTNLAWALNRLGRVGPGKVVGIVGGSFSGLMLAVILTMVDDVIVYVLEKENEILPRFRDKAHRHLSPVLNSRNLGKRFDPQFSSAEYRSPIFAWQSGRASDVANFWANEFAGWIDRLPIFPITGSAIEAHMVHHRHDGVDVVFDNPDRAALPLDLLIDATGFGEEGNPLELVDFSYWESGHRLIYDHLPRPAEVLISGCGDSGVIEALHYAIADFRHAYIEALWNGHRGLEAEIDEGLVAARLDGVLRSAEVERFDGEVISEIVWWRDQQEYMTRTPPAQRPFAGDPCIALIRARMDELMLPYWQADAARGPIESASPDVLDEFVGGLTIQDQLAVREGLRSLVAERISVRMKALAGDLQVGAENRVAQFARPKVRVVLNATTPTPYGRQLSPYNVWIMKVLMDLEGVSYRRGKIRSVARRTDNRFDVTFDDGGVETYDRVVSRYGPAPRPSSLAVGRQRNAEEGDWLLWYDEVPIPDASDPTGKKLRFINPPRASVVDAENRLKSRVRSADRINRDQFIGRVVLGLTPFHEGNPIYEEAQDWLSDQLARGIHPSYDGNAEVERSLRQM
jgi:hypothetical protein